jgi:hypothetical protein
VVLFERLPAVLEAAMPDSKRHPQNPRLVLREDVV